MRPYHALHLRRGLLFSRRARPGAPALAAQDRALEHAAAMDRSGDGMDSGRIRPAAVDYRRSSAHLSQRLQHTRVACIRQPRRLRRLLQRAAHRRGLSPAQVHQAGPLQPWHRPLRAGSSGEGSCRMILDYETLKVIWWLFVGVLLVGFALTDGWDLGVGTLLPFLGRTDEERRVIINSIGATWEGNQAWFIPAGGPTFPAV